MKIQRHVVGRRDQWLVALPAEVRRHLSLVTGARVWWHVGRKGQVTLTVSGRVRAGRPRSDEDCSSCAHYRAELDRLRRELREREAATPAQWFRQAFQQVESGMFWDLGDLVKGVRALLLQQRLLRERRKRRVRGASSTAPLHEEGVSPARPSPGPPPPGVASSEGEALAPGPSVPGQPIGA